MTLGDALRQLSILCLLMYLAYHIGVVDGGRSERDKQIVQTVEGAGIIRQGYAMKNEHGDLLTFFSQEAERKQDMADKQIARINEVTKSNYKRVEIYYKE